MAAIEAGTLAALVVVALLAVFVVMLLGGYDAPAERFQGIVKAFNGGQPESTDESPDRRRLPE